MKINLHENNWVINVTDCDVRTLEDQEVQKIIPLVPSNITVVIPNQYNLTDQEYRQFINRLGRVQKDGTPQRTDEAYVLPETEDEIVRVTGEKDAQGNNKGIFSQKEELNWHCNEAGRFDRPDALCLYGVAGTKGSITSYTNTQIAYQDLLNEKNVPEGLIESLPYLTAYYDYAVNLDDVKDTLSNPNNMSRSGRHPLLLKNKSGKQGIYISPKQRPLLYKNGMELDRKMKYKYVTFLYDFLTQQKYVYDHYWEDGDIVLNCQWNSLHKRNHFEEIEKRMLWRMMISFNI